MWSGIHSYGMHGRINIEHKGCTTMDTERLFFEQPYGTYNNMLA
jgi:hypothetical protein